METILNEIFKNVKVGIKIGNNVRVTKSHRRGWSRRNEIMLPSKAGMWEDQIMVDIEQIVTIRTKTDFDYCIIMDMYDGTKVTVEYSFPSNMRKDLNKIMERRQGTHLRPSDAGFYFEF